MPFSDSLKKQVRAKAAFQCCVCRRIGVGIEVHHIIPESEGGQDTLDNAAALCPTCHTEYGSDSAKRERIREMRDWWYNTVQHRYQTNPFEEEYLRRIDEKLEHLVKKQETDMSEFKVMLKDYVGKVIDHLNINTIVDSTATFANASLPFFIPKSNDKSED